MQNLELKYIDEFTIEDLGIIDDYVYDIEVENDHNFFGNNICVHNSVYIALDKIVNLKFKDDSNTKEIIAWIDKFCQKVLEPFIEKSYKELSDHMHAHSQKMRMKREAIADTGIWTAKKRYIMNVWNNEGVSYDKPKIKMVGIEAIRSSTPKACRDGIKKAIEYILNTDEETVQNFIKTFRTEFADMKFEEIAFPRGVSNLDTYISGNTYAKGTPIHARGSILYNRLIQENNLVGQYDSIGSGDKIKFCYLKEPNPSHSNVISCSNELPPQFGLDKYLDFDTQFEKAFLAPLSVILNAVGWSTEKKSTIEGFFG